MRQQEYRGKGKTDKSEDITPFREALRHSHLPGSLSGLVIEDRDIVLRFYGSLFGLTNEGRFRYVEVKYTSNRSGRYGEKRDGMNGGQRNTFILEHQNHILGDPSGCRYDGFYMLLHNFGTDDKSERHHPDTRYWLHHIDMPMETRVEITQLQVFEFFDHPFAVDLAWLPEIPEEEKARLAGDRSIIRYQGYKDNIAPYEPGFTNAAGRSLYDGWA